MARRRSATFEYPAPDSDLTALTVDWSFRQGAKRWREQPTGTGEAIDFATGKPAQYFYVRVPATDWTVVWTEHPSHDASGVAPPLVSSYSCGEFITY